VLKIIDHIATFEVLKNTPILLQVGAPQKNVKLPFKRLTGAKRTNPLPAAAIGCNYTKEGGYNRPLEGYRGVYTGCTGGKVSESLRKCYKVPDCRRRRLMGGEIFA
jgi:hypothetical protein